jgi:hypothetical protein
MRIKIEQSKEKISRRSGFILVNEFGKRIELDKIIDKEFGRPGSNRGLKASLYVNTLVSMFHDGAIHLEDVRHLWEDKAFQEILQIKGLPTSDALGDWLRREGSKSGEKKIWDITRQIMPSVSEEDDLILDIDTTIIESNKGDSLKTYKGSYGYHPLIGVIEQTGFVAGSQFRPGNISPQEGLWDFIKECEVNCGKKIKIIRSDSAGYQRQIAENCIAEGKYFSITARQTTSVLEAVKSIPEEQWQQGKDKEGIKQDWQCAQSIYTMSSKKKSFRMIAKRERLINAGLFDEYSYWIIATNLPDEEYSPNQVILFHQRRGIIEKVIGELKNQLNLDHMPCGQFEANSLYFTIGILAYNILQWLKWTSLPPEYRKKSIRTLRYQLLHLAGKLIYHSRYVILKLAAPLINIKILDNAYCRLRLNPL